MMDLALPCDAFRAAREGCDAAKVAERYLEPITAMEDEDLKFPENIAFAYYSIYNLFCKYTRHRDIDDWIIVNQALSSEPEEAKSRCLFTEAMDSLSGTSS